MSTYGGIDLGGTKIQAAILDDEYRALGSARRPTPTEGGSGRRRGGDGGRPARRGRRRRRGSRGARGRGRGISGTVEAGTVTSARNLPGWEGSFPLAAELERALGCKVAVGKDVGVATEAEFSLGAGRPYKSVLGVFWGTGVGGGLILDRKPWTGRGGAGEIGHVVVEIDGARCTCGRRGCMEAYAGRLAMERHVRKLHEEKGRKTDLFKLMKQHDRIRLTSGSGRVRSRTRTSSPRRCSTARSGRSARGSPRPSTCSTSRP